MRPAAIEDHSIMPRRTPIRRPIRTAPEARRSYRSAHHCSGRNRRWPWCRGRVGPRRQRSDGRHCIPALPRSKNASRLGRCSRSTRTRRHHIDPRAHWKARPRHCHEFCQSGSRAGRAFARSLSRATWSYSGDENSRRRGQRLSPHAGVGGTIGRHGQTRARRNCAQRYVGMRSKITLARASKCLSSEGVIPRAGCARGICFSV